MKQGILFDLDGTLWNSSKQVIAAWNRALKKCPDIDYGITEEQMRGFMGKTVDEIAPLFFKGFSKDRAAEILHLCLAEEVFELKTHGGTLYPHLEETLRTLSGSYQLGIVSNCQMNYLQAFFDYHKLGGYFSDWECAGRTGLSKGENIRLVQSRNHLEQVVYVGDTQGDCDAAEFAKVPFLHAAYGFGEVRGDSPKMDDITELPHRVLRLMSNIE